MNLATDSVKSKMDWYNVIIGFIMAALIDRIKDADFSNIWKYVNFFHLNLFFLRIIVPGFILPYELLKKYISSIYYSS